MNFGGAFLLSALEGTTPTCTLPNQKTSCTNFYTPDFTATLGNFDVKVSSNSGTMDFAGVSSGAHVDLWPIFAADILANNPLGVTFYSTTTFTIASGNYVYTSADKNKTEIFGLTETVNFMPGVNDLTFAYNPSVPSTVSEPSSIALFGSGLIGVVGAVRRRFCH